MEYFLSGIVLLSSLILIASVLLQEGKSAGMSGAVSGGAESLFGKNRAKGLQALLQKITVISSVIFMLSIFIFSIIF